MSLVPTASIGGTGCAARAAVSGRDNAAVYENSSTSACATTSAAPAPAARDRVINRRVGGRGVIDLGQNFCVAGQAAAGTSPPDRLTACHVFAASACGAAQNRARADKRKNLFRADMKDLVALKERDPVSKSAQGSPVMSASWQTRSFPPDVLASSPVLWRRRRPGLDGRDAGLMPPPLLPARLASMLTQAGAVAILHDRVVAVVEHVAVIAVRPGADGMGVRRQRREKKTDR